MRLSALSQESCKRSQVNTLLTVFDGDSVEVVEGDTDGVLLGLLEGDRLRFCVGCGCRLI